MFIIKDSTLILNEVYRRQWWHKPLILALERQRQVDLSESEVSLVYRVPGLLHTEKPCLGNQNKNGIFAGCKGTHLQSQHLRGRRWRVRHRLVVNLE